MRRRQFITFLGGAAAWPVAARAQRQDRTRRVAVLMALAQDDAEAQLRARALEAGLGELGWVEGRNASAGRSGCRSCPSETVAQVLPWLFRGC